MADTKIGMKIEEEIKPLKELCEKIVKMAAAEVDKGAENIDTHEMYEVADIIKDLAEAKKDTVEACYKIAIAEAMEENADSYGDEWDEDGLIEGRRNYRGQPRNSKGQYMSQRGNGRGGMGYVDPTTYRLDMDLYKRDPRELRAIDAMRGAHYYTDGMNMANNSGNGQSGMNGGSRLERARRNYEEKHDMQSLEELMTALREVIDTEKPMMDANQKNMAKSKLTNILNSI